MNPTELTPLIEPLLQLAKTAGERIMAIYNADDIGQRLKADQSPVTVADLAAHNVLAPRITAPSRLACSVRRRRSIVGFSHNGLKILVD